MEEFRGCAIHAPTMPGCLLLLCSIGISFLDSRPAQWTLTPGHDLPDWFPFAPEPPNAQ